MTALPADVAIQTFDENGARLRTLYYLWGEWLKAIETPRDGSNPTDDMTFEPMLDASDEFQAAMFSALHGFYRPAIGCARNALELVTIGTSCQSLRLERQFVDWRGGRTEFSFGSACDRLINATSLQSLRTSLAKVLDDSLFDQKTQDCKGGWIRRLYTKLSNYAHSRPNHTSGDMWSSNGPIYAPDAFKLFFDLQVETFAACYVLTKIANPSLQIEPETRNALFVGEAYAWREIATTAAKYLGL